MDINVTNNENNNVMRHYIKRLLICIAILTANTAAWAESYVITNGTYFLYNNDGSIGSRQDFDPTTCIWTYSNNQLNNQSYFLDLSSSSSWGNTTYYLSLESSSSTNWYLSGKQFYTTTTTMFGGRTTYYRSIYYDSDNSSWDLSSNRSSLGSTYSPAYTIEGPTTQPAVETVTVKQATDRFTYQGDKTDFGIESFSYTPSYTYYVVKDNNNTTYYHTSNDTYVTDKPTAITNTTVTPTAYNWSISDNVSGNVTLSKTNEATAHATYDKKVDKETEATVTATITIPQSSSAFMTSDATVTGTANITLSNLLVPTISLNVPNEVYIGETITAQVKTNDDNTGTVTYSLDNTSYATIGASTGEIKGVAVEKDKNASEVKVTAKVAASGTYIESTAEAIIYVKKRPTTLTLDETSKTITFGDAAPKLSCKVTDDRDNNKELTNPKVRYSSSETFIKVDDNGQISVEKAGSAVITAHYTGDDTYAAAEDAKFTITVNKAKTTVTFGDDDNYFVRFTDGFKNAPTATLTPSAAGSVTYSCTSSPEGLVTVDASTGEVTLKEVNGTREGTATITATFAGDDRYNAVTASYNMTVSTRAIPNFSVDMENSLYVGDNTHKITVETNSSGSLSYSSDNTAVLEVDKTTGLMTAKKEGTADVTVKMEGDATYIPMEATFTVTVKRYPTKLEINDLEKEYYTDHDDILLTVSLTETVNGTGVSGETDKYTYASSNTSVLTVSQNASGSWVIKPVGAGTASVTVTFAGDDKYEGSHASWQITVKRTAMPGDFIRIKNASGNYLTATADVTSTTATIEWSSNTTDESASNIIYYGKDGSLLFYECGRYIKNATPTLEDVGDKGYTGTAFTLTRDGDKYTISESNGTGNLGDANTADLTVEIVDCLPLTFKDAGHGYSTLYCPVNLRTPAGVSAYYATERKDGASNNVDYIITLKEVLHGVMPANTPLVLKKSAINPDQMTYDFHIIDETSDIKDALTDFMAGTLPTIKTSSVYSTDSKQCPYTLQPTNGAETVGFYPWESGKHTTIEPFRCYIPGANVKKSASQAKGFRFVFDGDDTTAIESIEVPAATATSDIIYNLQGIAVGTDINALPAGVYIQGGKKVRK